MTYLKRYFLLLSFCYILTTLSAQKYSSLNGLVMAGYQGWFNTPDDGSGRGWHHYQKNGEIKPGMCTFDMWPDMEEYKKVYKTPFRFEDGTPAYLFSSYDESTIDLHFKWMADYGIDGIYIQRFIVTLKSEKGRAHSDKVLKSAMKAAKKYNRALAIMYDLSGMRSEDYQILLDDWVHLVTNFKITNSEKFENYLFHKNAPVVAVWGVGFNDNRKYGLKEVEQIVDFLKKPGKYGSNSVHLGIPTHWRELKTDCVNDSEVHRIIKKADVVHPWLVGRYNEKSYTKYKDLIKKDQEWCKANQLDYIPTVFPGFSWYNMKTDTPVDMIPRNKGQFLWKQFTGAIEAGCEMIYVAMFDEIDEATAIFKCAHRVPVGESKFVAIEEDVPTDHYLWLTGMAGKMLNKEIPFQETIPIRE